MAISISIQEQNPDPDTHTKYVTLTLPDEDGASTVTIHYSPYSNEAITVNATDLAYALKIFGK